MVSQTILLVVFITVLAWTGFEALRLIRQINAIQKDMERLLDEMEQGDLTKPGR